MYPFHSIGLLHACRVLFLPSRHISFKDLSHIPWNTVPPHSVFYLTKWMPIKCFLWEAHGHYHTEIPLFWLKIEIFLQTFIRKVSSQLDTVYLSIKCPLLVLEEALHRRLNWLPHAVDTKGRLKPQLTLETQLTVQNVSRMQKHVSVSGLKCGGLYVCVHSSSKERTVTLMWEDSCC